MTATPLSEANRIIDDAAVAAGRSPGDVRRLLNLLPVPGRDAAAAARTMAAS